MRRTVKKKRPYRRKLTIKETKMTQEQQQAIVDAITPIQAVTGGSFSVTFTPSEVPVVPQPVTFTIPATIPA